MSSSRAKGALGILLLAAISLPIATPRADDLTGSGEADFRMYCADCHGEDGRGNGPRAFGLSVPPPDLTKLAERHDGDFPREQVSALIDGRASVSAHGSREMPVWGKWFKIEAEEGLGGAEGDEGSIRKRINALVDYLISIQQ
ncbi:MAG: c-type cytochrome [Rhizobiales bacterium]|nr:c-type cytochrome [Hyphomicrobiales bacterium]